MKRISLLICLLSFLSITLLNAQKISLGPELGLSIIPTEKTDIGNNYQLGYFFGAQVKYQLNEKLSLKSGLFLSQKKKQYSSIDTTIVADPIGGLLGGFGGQTGGIPGIGGDDEAEEYKTTTGIVTELYLQFPVLANYEIAKINVFAGPYVGLLLSAQRKEQYKTESTATDVSSFLPSGFGALGNLFQPANNEPSNATINSKDGLSSIDLGLTAGIGYRIDKLNFNVYYSYGFLDYRKDKTDNELETHHLTTFSITYLFNLGGSKGLKNRYDLDIE